MENIPNLHILGLSVENAGQSERDTVINMQLNAYLSMQPFQTGDTYWLHDCTYLASVIGTKARTEQIIKGGGGDVICAHP